MEGARFFFKGLEKEKETWSGQEAKISQFLPGLRNNLFDKIIYIAAVCIVLAAP